MQFKSIFSGTKAWYALACCCCIIACSSTRSLKQDRGWISLFDGKTFNGWKAGENPGTFTIEDGSIKVAGVRSHLYYDGSVMNHDFTNFEF
jgi:hypothetical protein